MAFLLPPCPNCSGVLRSRPDIDAARCRCGFEICGMSLISASMLPESGRAVYMLAHGRMVPIPKHEPGIRIGPDAGALRAFGWDHRYEPWRALGLRQILPAAAVERSAQFELGHQGEVNGAHMVLPDGPDRRRIVESRLMYGLAPPGQERECARQMVDAIVAAHGPGRWWTSGRGAVHVILSGDDAAVCDIGGIPHVALRSIYFHDPAPITAAPVDPLDVMYDGLTLRQLLECRALADQEGRAVRFTLAQRAAVSAHWSAQLRTKVAASVAADKARETSVVVDLEDW